MDEKRIVWRSELMAATGWTVQYFRLLVRRGKIPKPDVPHRNGRNGSEPGWYLASLPEHIRIKMGAGTMAEMGTAAEPAAAIEGRAEFLFSSSPPVPPPLAADSQALAIIPPAPGSLTVSTTSLVRAHPVKYQRIAAMHGEAVIRFDGAESVEAKKAVVEMWNMENPQFHLSLPTLYRLAARIKQGEDLLPRWGGQVTCSVPDIPFKYFVDYYLTQQQRSAQVCRDQLLLEYPDIPSADAFLRRLKKEIPKSYIHYYRKGPSAYDRKYGCYIPRDYTTIAPGQISVMDHHQVDVAVAGRDGKPMFPWVTVCMDARSRKYLGWAFSACPNSDYIHLAFRRACLRFGVPKELLIDNGKDFRSRTFAGGIKKSKLQIDEAASKPLIYQLGVIPHFALPYNAKSKPVERSFLTIKERFSRLLPSFRGGDVTERPEELQALIDSGKIPPIGDFEKLYSGFVEAEFNNRPHRGHGMDGRSPNEVFAEGNVSRPVDESLLDLLLLKTTRPVMVGKNGVTHWDEDYFAESLLTRKGDWVYLRYDPEELGRVLVYSERDEFICQATMQNRVAWHASEEIMRERNAIKKQEKRIRNAYHEQNWRRDREPDLLKALIARKAAEHGTDLREGTLHPEKPLLAGMRMSQREREKMQEAEDDRRRELAREFCEMEVPETKKEEFFDEDMKRSLGVYEFGRD